MKPTTGKWRAHTEGRGVKQPRGHRKGPPLPQTTRSPGRTGPAVEITIVKRNSQRSFPRIQRRMTGTPCVIFQNTHRTLTKATYNATRTTVVRDSAHVGFTAQIPLPNPYRGMYKFVDLEGTWLSGAFSVLNRRVDKGIVAS